MVIGCQLLLLTLVPQAPFSSFIYYFTRFWEIIRGMWVF